MNFISKLQLKKKKKKLVHAYFGRRVFLSFLAGNSPQLNRFYLQTK